MAAAPTREAVKSLYTSMLRTSQSFSSYNFRHYFVKRTKDSFQAMEAEKDTTKLAALYADAVKEHTVLKRSAIVNQLYGGWTLAVEKESEEGIRQRGDN